MTMHTQRPPKALKLQVHNHKCLSPPSLLISSITVSSRSLLNLVNSHPCVQIFFKADLILLNIENPYNKNATH
ncbi:hypothetical protein Hanom_Chr11g00972161 [Helianthus anomalus]